MQHKRLVVIETPPWVTTRIQVTDLMSDEELKQARLERPDLIFTLASDLPVVQEPVKAEIADNVPTVFNMDNPLGLTVKGMTLPYNLEELAQNILNRR